MIYKKNEISKDASLINNSLLTEKKISKSDYARIIFLRSQWTSYLKDVTFFYIYFFFSSEVFTKIIKSCLINLNKKIWKEEIREVWYVYVLLFYFSYVSLVLLTGVIYSADGIISSWLKGPFGQICYSINKSGISYDIADKIVNDLTEVNEHFKETYKKFGIITISKSFKNCWEVASSLETYKDQTQKLNKTSEDHFKGLVLNNTFFDLFWNFSLLVPLAIAFYKIREFNKTLDLLEEK